MKAQIVSFALSVVVGCLGVAAAVQAEDRMLAHDVYFSLKDASPEARAKLVAGCKAYLTGHPGVVWFSVGAVAPEFDRPVNDRDFDVALHLVFKNKAAHDVYQVSERHNKFVGEFRETFKKIRVFDSYLEASDHGDTPTGPHVGK